MTKEAFVAHDDLTGTSKHNRIVEKVLLDEAAHLLAQVDASFLASDAGHAHRIEQVSIEAPEVDEPETLAQSEMAVFEEAAAAHSTCVVVVSRTPSFVSTLVVRGLHHRKRSVAATIRRWLRAT